MLYSKYEELLKWPKPRLHLNLSPPHASSSWINHLLRNTKEHLLNLLESAYPTLPYPHWISKNHAIEATKLPFFFNLGQTTPQTSTQSQIMSSRFTYENFHFCANLRTTNKLDHQPEKKRPWKFYFFPSFLLFSFLFLKGNSIVSFFPNRPKNRKGNQSPTSNMKHHTTWRNDSKHAKQTHNEGEDG